MEMNYNNNYWGSFTKLGALLICRAANLNGLELESLAVMLVLYFTTKREWGFTKVGARVPWFPSKPNLECLP
jgi:hypothetical protein